MIFCVSETFSEICSQNIHSMKSLYRTYVITKKQLFPVKKNSQTDLKHNVILIIRDFSVQVDQ